MTSPLSTEQLAEIEARHSSCTDECPAHRLAGEVRRQREALDEFLVLARRYESNAGWIWRPEVAREIQSVLGES